jgi:hypothetical protein
VAEVKSLRQSDHNRAKVQTLNAVLEYHLTELLRPGVFGTLTVELVIKDGTIREVSDVPRRVRR